MSPKKRILNTVGILFWTLTAIFVVLPSWPHIYYRLFPQSSGLLASTIASTAVVASDTIKQPLLIPSPSEGEGSGVRLTPAPPSSPLPDVDPTLPAENGLIIDKIGVRGEIHEGDDWQKILKTGIWRVPSFATPTDSVIPGSTRNPAPDSRPIILAAHRWGYLEWSASFRKLNSFYNLPQLKVGDTIKVIWDQRPFEYKIYSTETGTQITDYKAKLILYTCQLWNSPIRFFVYANRVN